MPINKLSQGVWDKLTSVEKKEFSQLLKAQTDNIKVTNNPAFIVSKEESDKFDLSDMTIPPPGIALESKMVTKKVHLPYTVVSEEMVDEFEQVLSVKDGVVQSVAKQIAAEADLKIMQEAKAALSGESASLYDKAKKMIFSVDPGSKDKSGVSLWSNKDDLQHFDQSKTIFNTEPFELKDQSMLMHYKLPITYELWDQYPELKQKYKVGAIHKMEGTVFEVVGHEKDILHHEIVILFKEAENIGMTGPNDSLMDGIGGNGGDTLKGIFLDDKVTIDELTITPPADDIEVINLKERSERSKLFHKLTHGESLNE